MDLEFHYYINLIVAKLGGFSLRSSEIIAYSSQYVDDNTKYTDIALNSNCNYSNQITQTSNITLCHKYLKQLYACFHFQPGAVSYKKFWVTKPCSPLSTNIFAKALSTKNPYMIGIASHALADTFAHQDFVGYSNTYNSPIAFTLLPSYGHMYFGEPPDMIGIKWCDIRHEKIINNNVRFLKAAITLLECYSKLNLVTRSSIIRNKRVLRKALTSIFGKANHYIPGVEINKRDRIQEYKNIYKELSGIYPDDYCSKKWLHKAAYYCNVQKCWIALHDFENSHWFNFQQQAKNYQNLASQAINSHRRYNAF